MKILEQRTINDPDIRQGHFNGGEHLFVELTPGVNQTVSVRLPTGKHVTFAFVPKPEDPNGFECVDIHSTVGRHWTNKRTVGEHHFQQLAIGFRNGGAFTFDTREGDHPTSLVTLLLSDSSHKEALRS